MCQVGPELAILITPYQSVYVEIPKVACSSIKIALSKLLGIKLDGPNGDPHQSTFPLMTPDLERESMFPGLFSFAFVRNPWSRLVSCYRDKILFEANGFTHATKRSGVADCFAHYDAIRPRMLFDEFVEVVASIPDDHADAHFRSQHTFIESVGGRITVDHIGRFETLKTGLRAVQEKTHMPSFSLPRSQATGTGTNYKGFYNAHTRALVERRFDKDIALFEYTF